MPRRKLLEARSRVALWIVGLGHSGRELARLVSPFQMNVLAFSPHADPEQAKALGVRLTSLEDLMRQSDFVSLHCRLTEATRGLITAQLLALLKPSSYFINVGRGELVDQQRSPMRCDRGGSPLPADRCWTSSRCRPATL